jgi:hypothetical protein
VPIMAGGKVNGRIGNTSFGGLAIGTRREPGVVEDNAFMAVGRVKHNLWRESWVGAIATVGDPLARPGSWLGGADFTYATSHFRGDNTRLRWTFLPVADLFIVYNHNIRSILDRWRLDSNQLLIKLQYAWRL